MPARKSRHAPLKRYSASPNAIFSHLSPTKLRYVLNLCYVSRPSRGGGMNAVFAQEDEPPNRDGGEVRLAAKTSFHSPRGEGLGVG